jgi:hypothetical protein
MIARPDVRAPRWLMGASVTLLHGSVVFAQTALPGPGEEPAAPTEATPTAGEGTGESPPPDASPPIRGDEPPPRTPSSTEPAATEAAPPSADGPVPSVPNPAALSTRMRRPHGMIEVGLGWLTLPDAEVCSVRSVETDCLRGDSSPALEAWQLFRLPPAYALGAGVMLGLIPTTDTPAQGMADVKREHSRGYLTIEGTGRVYPYVRDKVEAWAGLTAGLVVVSDTFETRLDSEMDKPLIGSGGVIIRTEGFASTLAGGVAYEVSRGWSVGGTLRLGSWFLPRQPKVSPLGDEASLAGRASFFVAGLVVAYRVPL